MPFLTYDPLPQCLQHSSATRRLLALDHDRGCTRYLLEVKCLRRLIIKGVRSLGYDIVKTVTTKDDSPVDVAQDGTFLTILEKCRAFTMTQLEDMHAPMRP